MYVRERDRQSDGRTVREREREFNVLHEFNIFNTLI